MVFSKTYVVQCPKIALLLGGCLYEDYGLDALKTNTKKKRSNKFHSKEDIKKDENLWAFDFEAIESFIAESSFKIWKSFPTQYKALRNENFQRIQDMMNQDAGTYLIYWCGHGEPDTGNWCFFDDDTISLENILEAWKNSFGGQFQRNLIIIADTCHSGNWIERFEKSNNEWKDYNIAIQSACRPEEEAFIENEGMAPRSLLMRKFIHERNHMADGLDEASSFTWCYSKQHPQMAIIGIQSPQNEPEEEDGAKTRSNKKKVAKQGLNNPRVFNNNNNNNNPPEQLVPKMEEAAPTKKEVQKANQRNKDNWKSLTVHNIKEAGESCCVIGSLRLCSIHYHWKCIDEQRASFGGTVRKGKITKDFA